MAVSVVVPWRPGCEHREAAWRWVRSRYASAHPDWELVEGRHETGDWCKAHAVADGIAAATSDLLVIADADVWCDGTAEAVELVAQGACWATPHGRVRRLTVDATADVLAGGPLTGPLEQVSYLGHAGGGITVLRRAMWDEAPMDPRFVGWGQEDDAWALALTALAGKPKRLGHDLWHLWHPSQPRASRQVGSVAGRRLFDRYWRARHSRERMRSLLDEFRVGAT